MVLALKGTMSLLELNCVCRSMVMKTCHEHVDYN